MLFTNIFYTIRRLIHRQKDFGIRVRKPKKPEYKSGDGKLEVRLGASKQVLMDNGQWIDVFIESKPELQKRSGFETFYCVTASAIRHLVLLAKVLFDEVWNKSERFTAKASNTTRSGNTGQKVADSIRRDGLVDEEDYPWPPLPTTWDEFYKDLPEDLRQKGLEFKQSYKVGDEWVQTTDKANLMEALKYAPLQVYVKAWFRNSAEDDIYFFPFTAVWNHAVVLIGYVEGEYWLVGDQYEPFVKKIAWDQNFYTWAKRFSLTKLEEVPMDVVTSPKKKPHFFVLLPDGSKSVLVTEASYQEGLDRKLFNPVREISDEEMDKYPENLRGWQAVLEKKLPGEN